MDAWTYKPPTVDAHCMNGIRKLDDSTIRLPRPRVVAGRRIFKIKKESKRYRTTKCPNCELPFVWIDYKYKGTGKIQINTCSYCKEKIATIIKGNIKGRIKSWLAE